MTVGELKASLEALLNNDMLAKASDDSIVIPLINEGVKEIALECEPLNLIVRDFDAEALKVYDDGFVLIIPPEVRDDEDVIPLHGILNSALVQWVAMHIAVELKDFFHAKYRKLKNDYLWQKQRDATELLESGSGSWFWGL